MMQHATSPSRSSHDPEHSRGSKREAPDVLLPQSTLDHFSLLSCLHQCEHLWTSLHLPTPLRFMETLLSSPLGALNPWRDRKRLLTTTHASYRVRAGLKLVERAVREKWKPIFYITHLTNGDDASAVAVVVHEEANKNKKRSIVIKEMAPEAETEAEYGRLQRSSWRHFVATAVPATCGEFVRK